MNSKTVDIAGQDYTLHPRYAVDVLKIMEMDAETEQDNIRLLATAVSDALVDNWRDLKGRKQKRVKAILSPVGLLQNVSIARLAELWEMVNELEKNNAQENSKKK